MVKKLFFSQNKTKKLLLLDKIILNWDNFSKYTNLNFLTLKIRNSKIKKK